MAQSYKNCGYDPDMLQTATINGNIGDYPISELPGWNNKMFTYPSMMPNKIRITNVRVERLQDISDEECIKEGIIKKWHAPACRNYYYIPNVVVKRKDDVYDTPRESYAALIDRISGKGTWQSNPFVFVYDFELVEK